jgi:hypothetical protein
MGDCTGFSARDSSLTRSRDRFAVTQAWCASKSSGCIGKCSLGPRATGCIPEGGDEIILLCKDCMMLSHHLSLNRSRSQNRTEQ